MWSQLLSRFFTSRRPSLLPIFIWETNAPLPSRCAITSNGAGGDCAVVLGPSAWPSSMSLASEREDGSLCVRRRHLNPRCRWFHPFPENHLGPAYLHLHNVGNPFYPFATSFAFGLAVCFR
ncbi:hypothetical protein KC356_g173 [Hortaea werneckii]|nr:hypothetical protein KC356_g173 [Hortaea werneckii]